MIEMKSPVYWEPEGDLTGLGVVRSRKSLRDLQGYFADEEAYAEMNPDFMAYEVCSWMPVPEGTPGGLFYGISTVYPGRVGKEFIMTKGHFHAQSCAAEFYRGTSGRGLLLLMDRNRQVRAELVESGSLHYIPGHVAHRLVNIGDEPLKAFACWPSDAGHDYSCIEKEGFSVRILAEENSCGYRAVESNGFHL